MSPNDLIKDIRTAIIDLVKEKYDQQGVAIEKDVDKFLEGSKEKLIRWTLLLEQEQLSKEEFELLLHGQKDIFVIKTLYQAGVSKISLGHFKNKIIGVAVESIFRAII